MSAEGTTGWKARLRLVHLSTRMMAGRRYWIWPFAVLLWPLFQMIRLLVGWRDDSFAAAEAQNFLIGIPLTVLAMALGMRIIAGEVDARTLEIAYTVPGGTKRVWWAKIFGVMGILLAAEGLAALFTYVFLTSFPVEALYGAFQAAVLYGVLCMGLGALFKSESAGGLVAVAILGVNFVFQGAGSRLSPFFNPANFPNEEVAQVIAWTIQNRIGFVLVIAAVIALSFGRSDQRERMLGT